MAYLLQVVLPFRKFPGCDTLLGPEMRSTGEVRTPLAGREAQVLGF
jgi:carbamoylphosphate synthase large subunit